MRLRKRLCNEYLLVKRIKRIAIRFPIGCFGDLQSFAKIRIFRWSMIQYADLFNSFPTVRFPISVLASVSNQELVDYAWIFPNVIANGHWWYSNTPTFIRHDLRARIDAIPRNKIIGYYSDAYKLEFILPKYRMFKRILANVLAESIVCERGLSETFAVELGTQLLRGNVDAIFFGHE